ncbi:site-specific integrase [Arthrobacter sp. A2-55]|uniref:site-specific integrase n=1 Tax=Arthrobacter sp. A2-55 TaxID=2897337 RepID=UPI0021CD8D88|nr:site-specific integrase [Arthrobacter sp. A2-55]MCU6479662.1 tyrosine-type recombinase/integrase [Arthrobacter sp. A2-55]
MQYQDLRQMLIHWETAPALGRPRTQELHEISDFLIATGVRPGELFALRWNDVDLDAEPPTVFINATVIRTTAGGVRIQNHPKSQHGIRHLTIPDFLVEQLRERSKRQTESRTPNSLNLIFPSTTGTVCDANNVGKLWRKVADSIGYNWVTLKTFRKPMQQELHVPWASKPPQDLATPEGKTDFFLEEDENFKRPGVSASRRPDHEGRGHQGSRSLAEVHNAAGQPDGRLGREEPPRY